MEVPLPNFHHDTPGGSGHILPGTVHESQDDNLQRLITTLGAIAKSYIPSSSRISTVKKEEPIEEERKYPGYDSSNIKHLRYGERLKPRAEGRCFRCGEKKNTKCKSWQDTRRTCAFLSVQAPTPG
eukprot:GHVR01164185.1.p1 GENE.GHVR01164185.1~~GHVR01164185.1.p1  ORF type:complete len:126 (+),score=0.59 GHVR01164185.1:336-713(+)